ncbi:MAG: hypothetical protein AB1696_25875 [Planctomycetota bacterium]
MNTRIVVAVVAALALVGLAADEDESLLLGPEYENAKGGFAFRPPAHWQEGRPGEGGGGIVFTGPTPPSPPPTISVAVVEASIPFSRFVAERKAELSSACAQVVIHSQVRYLIGGEHDAWRMVFSFSDAKGNKRTTLLAADAGERYVVVHCTCPEDSEERFRKAFEASMRSFRVLPSAAEAERNLAETYADEDEGFSLNPPTGWSVDRSGKLGPKVIFVGPKRPDGTVPNIVVDVREDARLLPAFVDAVRESLRKSNNDFQVRADRIRYDEAGEMADALLEYTFTFNNVSLQSIQLFTAGDGGRKYTLTCAAPSKWFPSAKRLFHRVCDTFRTFPPADSYRSYQLDEKRYVNHKEKLSLTPPGGWTLMPGEAPGMTVRFIGPPSEGYRPEINVVCDPNDAPLDDYTEAVQQAMAKSLTGLVIHAITQGETGKHPSCTIEFGAKSGETQLRNLKVIVAPPGRKLIFNLGAREGDFDEQKKIFLDCVRSLELQ